MTKENAIDAGVTAVMKAAPVAPPVTVSLAHVAGYPVADIVLWVTLIYTVFLLIHKIIQITIEARSFFKERRANQADPRPARKRVERRKVDE